MGAVMLTKKQKELLDYLTTHAEKHDVPPSFDEMRDALGLASKSGIHRLVSGLEERGYIRRLANRARDAPLALASNSCGIESAPPSSSLSAQKLWSVLDALTISSCSVIAIGRLR